MTPVATSPPAATPAAPPVGRTVPRSTRLLTVADLAALPSDLPSGGAKYELYDGFLVIMPPPGDGHARRQAKVLQYLGAIAEDQLGLGQVRGEVGVILRRNPDRVVGPDAAFILSASFPIRLSPEGYLETIPELVVEVRSKNDIGPETAAKREEYFDAGVLVVWAVDPGTRTVTAYRRGQPDQVFQVGDSLTSDLLPGFAVPVANLFAGS